MNAAVAAVVHCGKHALVLDTGSCLAASRITEMMENRGVPESVSWGIALMNRLHYTEYSLICCNYFYKYNFIFLFLIIRLLLLEVIAIRF